MLRLCLFWAAAAATTTTAAAAAASQRQLLFQETDNSTDVSCSESVAGRFICRLQSTVPNSRVEVDTNINCPLVATGRFDWQSVRGCSCLSLLTMPNGDRKPCPCTICPAGFGSTPIAIDCDYAARPLQFSPYIYGSCSTVDCGGTCNGDCTKGCDQDGCQGICIEPTEPPTLAPTLAPTEPPTAAPVTPPTVVEQAPTPAPPTDPPTDAPVSPPTGSPTTVPSDVPSSTPSSTPSILPTGTVSPTGTPPPVLPLRKAKPSLEAAKMAAKRFRDDDDDEVAERGQLHRRVLLRKGQ